MHSFKQRHLQVGRTLGEQFTQARESKKIPLAKASSTLAIQEKYLEAIEQSRNDLLPGDGYARSWVKRYAEFLGLDPEESLQLFNQEKNIHQQITPKEQKSNLAFRRRQVISKLTGARAMRILGISLAAVILVGYLIWFMFQTFQAPAVFFDQQLKDQKTTSTSMTISGHTESGAQLWFNDKIIMVDERGFFHQEIPLSDGLNIITIRAKKKHSREFEQTIQVVRQTPEETAAPSTSLDSSASAGQPASSTEPVQ